MLTRLFLNFEPCELSASEGTSGLIVLFEKNGVSEHCQPIDPDKNLLDIGAGDIVTTSFEKSFQMASVSPVPGTPYASYKFECVRYCLAFLAGAGNGEAPF